MKQSSFLRPDGLLRGACHRARVRATRWLAMTKSVTLGSSAAKSGALVLRSVSRIARRSIRAAVLSGLWLTRGDGSWCSAGTPLCSHLHKLCRNVIQVPR
jgi:hypothetical protein